MDGLETWLFLDEKYEFCVHENSPEGSLPSGPFCIDLERHESRGNADYSNASVLILPEKLPHLQIAQQTATLSALVVRKV